MFRCVFKHKLNCFSLPTADEADQPVGAKGGHPVADIQSEGGPAQAEPAQVRAENFEFARQRNQALAVRGLERRRHHFFRQQKHFRAQVYLLRVFLTKYSFNFLKYLLECGNLSAHSIFFLAGWCSGTFWCNFF